MIYISAVIRLIVRISILSVSVKYHPAYKVGWTLIPFSARLCTRLLKQVSSFTRIYPG